MACDDMVTKSVGFLKFGMEKRPGDVVDVEMERRHSIELRVSRRQISRLECDEFTAFELNSRPVLIPCLGLSSILRLLRIMVGVIVYLFIQK
jgi:hypothetical protein